MQTSTAQYFKKIRPVLRLIFSGAPKLVTSFGFGQPASFFSAGHSFFLWRLPGASAPKLAKVQENINLSLFDTSKTTSRDWFCVRNAKLARIDVFNHVASFCKGARDSKTSDMPKSDDLDS